MTYWMTGKFGAKLGRPPEVRFRAVAEAWKDSTVVSSALTGKCCYRPDDL